MANETYHFEIFADYFQIHLHNEATVGLRPDAWKRGKFPQAPRRLLLATSEGAIGVGTFSNVTVPIDVKVVDAAPNDPMDEWDFVADSGITVASGRLM